MREDFLLPPGCATTGDPCPRSQVAPTIASACTATAVSENSPLKNPLGNKQRSKEINMLNTLQSSRFGAALWLVLALQVPAAFATASTTTPPSGGALAVTKGSQLLAQAGAAQLASVPVVATAPPAPEKLNNAMPAWTVSCASPARAVAPDCKLEQRLFAKESQRRTHAFAPCLGLVLAFRVGGHSAVTGVEIGGIHDV
jgi:hypothetical protein